MCGSSKLLFVSLKAKQRKKQKKTWDFPLCPFLFPCSLFLHPVVTRGLLIAFAELLFLCLLVPRNSFPPARLPPQSTLLWCGKSFNSIFLQSLSLSPLPSPPFNIHVLLSPTFPWSKTSFDALFAECCRSFCLCFLSPAGRRAPSEACILSLVIAERRRLCVSVVWMGRTRRQKENEKKFVRERLKQRGDLARANLRCFVRSLKGG